MKVLHITVDLDGGGVDRLLYDYCSRMIPDHRFDFVVTSSSRGILEAPLEALGCRVFHLPTIRGDLRSRMSRLRSILIEGNYDAVHDHTGYRGLFTLALAQRMKIPCRIAHSHICNIPESPFQHFTRLVATRISKHFATDLFACGKDAAKWMWGADAARGIVKIMPNAINLTEFQFDSSIREEMRRQLKIDDKLVIGNIARFSFQKNHSFLIDVFYEITKGNDDAILLLIGGGELCPEIKKKVESIGLGEKVLFLGVRKDVPQLLNAMDIFLMPSLYEGLPVTLVEVQANGLPAIVSDSITDEILLESNCKSIALSKTTHEWASEVLNMRTERNADASLVEGKYDIDVAANNLSRWYFTRICQLRSLE